MSYLFSSPPPSYPQEQLHSHLSSLSTLPVSVPQSQSAPDTPSKHLESALHELSSSRPPSQSKLKEVLKDLADSDEKNDRFAVQSEIDRVVEREIMGRAVTIVWKEVLDDLMKAAVELEAEKGWWDVVLTSRMGVSVYLIQTLPHRIVAALPPHSSLSLQTFRQIPRAALFPRSPAAALSTLTSPYSLTRREILASKQELIRARDAIAVRIGTLASEGPKWSSESQFSDIHSETTRLYTIMCSVLEVPPPAPPAKRSKNVTVSPPSGPNPTPALLLSLLTTHLPRSKSYTQKVLSQHRRPTVITRFWFPLLFAPPALYAFASLVVRNKAWMREQVKNARETVKGFFIQWVWEPLEDIAKTLRGGGEGLGVAPTTVKSDQESLERMVLDLGRDYYHMNPTQLEGLGERIRGGDMEEVLRVYEKEMQNPVKNALLGSLIRTLLIQVQKTKTDLSLSLLSLDHLLRSQQLTFAFVGVAPSVLVLYGVGGYLRGVWKGEKRGKGRKRTYFNGLRDMERLLLTSPKKEEQMSYKDRGLLIVGVSSMRTWAAGLSGGSREGFLDDLRLVEEPGLGRADKLRVIERIWRCWGTDGKRRV